MRRRECLAGFPVRLARLADQDLAAIYEPDGPYAA
jgi:hypothetical protein